MTKSEKHIDLLVKRLSLVDRISTADAVELLKITESSVRRIFAQMEARGLALRLHGGLTGMSEQQSGSAYNYNLAETENLEQKKRIANSVAKDILQHNSVYLDSGSTLYRVSLALANALQSESKPNLKIFTNSLKNLEVLQGLCSIRVSGGDYRAHRHDFCGFIAENSVNMLNFDLCVLGADGVAEGGLTTTDFETAKLCMCAIKRSKTKLLAVDSSKFGKTALITYSPLSEISEVVTDSSVSEKYTKLLNENKIKTTLV